MIMGLEVITKKLLSLLDLAKSQGFIIHKLTKVVMVGKNKTLVFTDFQVVTSNLKSLNNSHAFLIIGLILNFYKNHFFGKKSY